MQTQEKSMRGTKIVAFILCLAIPMVVGIVSSLVSGNVRAEYDQLRQPLLSPPGWLFGIVWPVLYLMMGIACYLVVAADVPNFVKLRALSVYVLQLVANAFWSPVFFRGGMLWGALVVIIILDLLVLANIMAFWSVRKPAGLLLVPYFGWVLFATYLNASFALLN